MKYQDPVDVAVRELKLRGARYLYPPSQFSYAILVRLIGARGWCELAPGVHSRIAGGQIELKRADGGRPNPFLLR